jgi:yecA family protein
MTTTDMPDYEQLTNMLRQLELDKEAGEVQGIICGMLCARLNDPGMWMDTVLSGAHGGDEQVQQAREMLAAVYMNMENQLTDEGFNLTLILPDDETPVSHRAIALGQWCQGLLLGLSMGGLTQPARLSKDAQEILQDILSISRAETYDTSESEANEKAYMELTEYVRIGSQLLHEEMRNKKES